MICFDNRLSPHENGRTGIIESCMSKTADHKVKSPLAVVSQRDLFDKCTSTLSCGDKKKTPRRTSSQKFKRKTFFSRTTSKNVFHHNIFDQTADMLPCLF